MEEESNNAVLLFPNILIRRRGNADLTTSIFWNVYTNETLSKWVEVHCSTPGASCDSFPLMITQHPWSKRPCQNGQQALLLQDRDHDRQLPISKTAFRPKFSRELLQLPDENLGQSWFQHLDLNYCKDWSSHYAEQTSRRLVNLLNEHQTAIRNCTTCKPTTLLTLW